jgi:hypothetical protein
MGGWFRGRTTNYRISEVAQLHKRARGIWAWHSPYVSFSRISFTYDHRLRRIGHPVRSAIHKPQIGGLVVGWVTTSEYLLLYVFAFFVFAQVCRDF